MASTSAKTASKASDIVAKTSKPAVPEGKFKLYYFDVNGRAFASRVALAAAGFDFEDKRISFAELKELRAGKDGLQYNEKVPLGKLPVLLFPDGEQSISQSAAISRFAGKYCGLYPQDPLKAIIVDEIMDACSDFLTLTPQSDDKDLKKALREKYATEQLPKYFDLFATRLAKSGGPFFLGENLSVADLTLFGVVDLISSGFFDHISPDVLKPWKSVLEQYELVKNHPIVVKSKLLKA